MTSDAGHRRPRRNGPSGPQAQPNPLVPGKRGPSADQGDLWADQPSVSPQGPAPEEERQPDGLETFVSALEPPDAEVLPQPPLAAGSAASRRRPSTSLAARPRVAPPVYEAGYQDEDYEYDYEYGYGDEDYSLLRNPYVLAALAVAAAIVLAIFVVIVFGDSGSGGGFVGGVASTTATPRANQPTGVVARSLVVTAVREGPSVDYLEIGLLRSGREVSVVGRDEDATWYEIILPDTRLRGWVPATALRLPENAQVAVVDYTPVPKPSVVQPTQVIATPAPTEQSLGPPDLELALLGNTCPASDPLVLALRNVGAIPVEDRLVRVTVSTPAGTLKEETLSVTLAPGQIAPIATGVRPQPPATTVTVVFINPPQDSNPANNVVSCIVQGSGSGGGGSSNTAVPPPIGTSAPDDDDD